MTNNNTNQPKENYHLKRSRKALEKFVKGKGDSAYKHKLINESIDEVTEFMKETMPKYIRTKSGMMVRLEDVLA